MKENIGICFYEVSFPIEREGPTFVYRRPGSRYDHKYSAILARSGRVSMSCWG